MVLKLKTSGMMKILQCVVYRMNKTESDRHGNSDKISHSGSMKIDMCTSKIC
jgi:hypothetical protein